MRRGPSLFLLSLFIVVLFLELWFVFPEFSGENSGVLVAPPVDADTAHVNSATKKDIMSSQAPELLQSFAYLGRVKTSTPHDSKSKNPGRNELEKKATAAGRNKSREGEIPELTIDLGSRDVATVAIRLGFVLAAATENKILGKIIDETFAPIGQRELSKFSTRARSAEMFDHYDEIRDRIAERFNLTPDEVRLMFLVPVNVERQWINTQRRVLSNLAVPPDEVALMRGSYDSNFNVRIEEVLTKDGNIIAIH